MTSPEYRYLLTDLLTDQIVTQLDLTGVSFERRISRVGSFSATMSIANATQVELGKLVRAYAGRGALWVYRGQQLWWGGVLWTANLSEDSRGVISLQLSGATFDSYAHRRRLYSDVTYGVAGTDIGHTLDGTDMGVVIPDLWRTIQSDSSGNIGVLALDQPTGHVLTGSSGPPTERVYLARDMVRVGKIIEDLGDLDTGPEHTIDTFLDSSGNRVKSLRVQNRLGSTVPRFVFQKAPAVAGRVPQWSEMYSASDGGTVFQVRGDAPSGEQSADGHPAVIGLSQLIVRSDLLGAGWPRLDVDEDRPGVTDEAVLTQYAQAMADELGGAAVTRGYTIEVGNSGWSPNNVGDVVRMKISDLWHGNSDELIRPVGCTVTAGDKNTVERVTLLLGDEAN